MDGQMQAFVEENEFCVRVCFPLDVREKYVQ